MTMPTLYWPATPEAYTATKHKGQGFFLGVGKGASLLDFDVRGVAAPYCTFATGIGMLDESASLEGSSALVAVNITASVIEDGTLAEQVLPARLEGYTPLRAFFLSAPIGRDIPGGKTLYAVEVITDCQDAIYVNALRRASSRDPFQSKTWAKIGPYATTVGMRTSGLEFMIMLYVKGGGKFRIFRVTAWLKLTDRRGLHTFGGIQSDNASAANEGA